MCFDRASSGAGRYPVGRSEAFASGVHAREQRTDMKTIGVIGGIGPQATMDFEARVHRAAQRLIPQRVNSGYPPMVVVYHRGMPVVFGDDGKPLIPYIPDAGLLERARELGGLVDFLVIAANFPHVIRSEIERAAGREVLSMIDLTLDEVRRRGWKRVGVLGMGLPAVYIETLEPLGIAHQTLDPGQRGALDRAILSLMEGRDTKATRQLAHQAVATLRGRPVDGIILGCTEIPLMMGAAAEAPDLVNPAQLLAEAAVARAIA